MSTHANLSPSKRHRWGLCPGSIREEAKYPDDRSGPAAIDGTHTHTMLEFCLSGPWEPEELVDQIMQDDDGSFVVDIERAQRVRIAVDYVKQRVAEQPGCKVIAEHRVNPQRLIARDDMSGTVDIQIHGTDVLEIVDYKDGMGAVQAEGNAQLELYAVGALADVGEPYPWKRVRMTIIQPKMVLRGLPAITSHEVDISEILAIVDRLVIEGAAVDAPDAPLVPGESQCKFCKAKGSCAALASNVMKEIGIMFQPVMSLDVAQQSADKDPSTMDDGQILSIMEAAPLMRQLLEGVEKEALRRLQSGQAITGLKLVNGRGSRVWAFEDDEIAEKLIKMGIPKGSVYETKLVSPAKAEKLTWEKRDGTKVQLTERQLKRMEQEYVVKMAGKLAVATESDSRPAVVMNAAPLFSAVEAAPVADTLPSWLL